ncbi:MAG TPA: helix-turn-helix transcriptional regulator [Gemmatimonadaceae bacterium]|nr:helix-turn-helix transcriptional regulator [Gemmatimonadaceae bacterium]
MTNVTLTPGPAIGRAIRDYRERRGVTLDAIARRIHTSHGYVGKIERGEVPNPSIGIVMAIAAAIGCTVGELVSEERPGAEAERLRGVIREARRVLDAAEVGR